MKSVQTRSFFWSIFSRIEYLSVFSLNIGKYGPEKTPHSDTFQAVEAYMEENYTERKFNPISWCTDMATANTNGLSQIYGYGILSRVKGCKFCFRQSVDKHSKKIDGHKQFL